MLFRSRSAPGRPDPHQRPGLMSSFDYLEYRLRFPGPLQLHRDASRPGDPPSVPSDLLYAALDRARGELGLSEGLIGRVRVSSAFLFTDRLGALAPLLGVDRSLSWVSVAYPEAGDQRPALLSAWTRVDHPRAQFDRVRGRAAGRFATPEVRFAANAGLWVAVRFLEPETAESDRRDVEAALRYLGDTGLGGGRSVGAGRFELLNATPVPEQESGEGAASGSGERGGSKPSESLWVWSRFRATSDERTGEWWKRTEARVRWESWRTPQTAASSGPGSSAKGAGEIWRFIGPGSVVPTEPALPFDPRRAGAQEAIVAADTGRTLTRTGFLFAVPAPVPSPTAASLGRAEDAVTSKPTSTT